MISKKFGCALLAASLQACVSPPTYTPMTSKTQADIQSLQVYNLVAQDEVRPAVEVSNVSGALGGGLLAAAIDASINDDRSNDARQLTNQFYFLTEDIDYRQLIAQSINPVLSAFRHQDPAATASAEVLPDAEIKQRVATLKTGESFMFITSHYAFHDNFKVLQTVTSAYLYVGNGGKMDYTKANYMNNFFYQSPHVGSGGADSVKLWSADNGKLFREQLQQSLNTLQANLRYDMQPLTKEECMGTVQFEFPTQLGSASQTGKKISNGADRTLLRAEDGALYSIASVRLTPAKKNICGA